VDLTPVSKNRILQTTILYTVLVFISEITLGNPAFPIHFWIFIQIPAWKWSIPVHLLGLIWLIFWNSRLKDKAVIWSILISILFFFLAETLNWYFFNFFIYSNEPFGEVASFWIVIILYISLCTICSFVLRRDPALESRPITS
jgi:hypothetical protein